MMKLYKENLSFHVEIRTVPYMYHSHVLLLAIVPV